MQSHHEGHEDNEGKPENAGLRSGFKAFRLWRPIPRLRDRWITPGEPPVANWDKQCFVCSPATAGRTVPPDFRQCEGLGVDSRKQTDAVLAYCKAKLTQKICPNGAIARKSGSPLHPSSGTFN